MCYCSLFAVDSALGATTSQEPDDSGESSAAAPAKDKPSPVFCPERLRLAQLFLDATRELIALQDRQMQAMKHGDPGFTRYDRLLHEAQERKEAAKYAWLAHVESHACEKD